MAGNCNSIYSHIYKNCIYTDAKLHSANKVPGHINTAGWTAVMYLHYYLSSHMSKLDQLQGAACNIANI